MVVTLMTIIQTQTPELTNYPRNMPHILLKLPLSCIPRNPRVLWMPKAQVSIMCSTLMKKNLDDNWKRIVGAIWF